MNQAPDRKKLRRDYLKKTRRFCSHLLLLAGIAVIGPLAVHSIVNSRDRGPLWPLGALVWIVFVAFALYDGVGKTRRALKTARQAYVPPVTPNILPAEEILVRGAAGPSATAGETLLRAAIDESAIKAEELLRVQYD